MPYISHIGKNVGLIYDMPMGGNGYPVSSEVLLSFKNFIEEQSFKYLTAITANTYQDEASKILKELKFKKVITFDSSHGGGETLSLWYKIQKDKKGDLSKKISYPNYNCSVSFGSLGNKNFSILTNPENHLNLVKINKTPIFYHLKNNNLIKSAVIKTKKKLKGFNMIFIGKYE